MYSALVHQWSLGTWAPEGLPKGIQPPIRGPLQMWLQGNNKKGSILSSTSKVLEISPNPRRTKAENNQKRANQAIRVPKTYRQVREFLETGSVGFGSQTLLLSQSPSTKPQRRGGEKEPPVWSPKQLPASTKLKNKLQSVPALGLPDLSKPFIPLVSKRLMTAVEVLVRSLGS